MKFKTFMNVVILGLVVLAVGTCYGCYHLISNRAPTPGPSMAVTSAPVATSTQSVSTGGLTPLEQKILGKAGQKIDSDKIKDAFPGPVKVNLYQDDPARGINRAKVDLDRDDKFDEKWTFGEVTVKEVSPNDDERYTRKWQLVDDGWAEFTSEPAGVVTPPVATTEAGSGAMRSFDQAVVDSAFRKISGDKEKDAVPGSVKVNLYQDNASVGINRAKIDLDRDEKWDEKWTFEKESDGSLKVKRQVAPADDEKYTMEYRLREGRWVAK